MKSVIIENFNNLTITTLTAVIMVLLSEMGGNRGIIKWKNGLGFWFLIVLSLFGIIIPTVGLVLFPAKTILSWLILSILFPLFLLKRLISWDMKSRIFYNIIFLILIFSSFIFLYNYQNLKKDFMKYVGFNYNHKTNYYIDSEGDERQQDYYYSFTGNKNLDRVIDNYSIVFFSFSILLISFLILLIDRNMRIKILNQDNLELENQKKEQDYLDE